MAPTKRALNTTSQNRKKQLRIRSEHIVPKHGVVSSSQTSRFLEEVSRITAPKEAILYALGKRLVGRNTNPAYMSFVEEYHYDDIELPLPPTSEIDLLGVTYQFLNSKLENLSKGSFYTGIHIARDLVSGLKFDRGQTIMDPSCGSGMLLLTSDAAPEQLIGIDNDPIAVMIAKFNYFVKFPDAPSPRIFLDDFFQWSLAHRESKFSYIVGNPPYGAELDLDFVKSRYIKTSESFSLFLECAVMHLDRNGVLRFLVPEALLNVKRHKDIRDFLLEHVDLNLIKRYKGGFHGVMSSIFRLDVMGSHAKSEMVRFIDSEDSLVPKRLFAMLKDHIFSELTSMDIKIIDKVHARCESTLKGSIFGLGVVTGDNASRLLEVPTGEAECIFTGKDVDFFTLRPCQNYLVFERASLQQVAPDYIYRAPEKIVYKTISKRLKVAVDYTGALTTNSANIIIPKVAHNNTVSIAALLNSTLYSFLNVKLFGGVNKVARGNLENLPIPFLTDQQLADLAQLVAEFQGDFTRLDEYVCFEIFDLTLDELQHVIRAV